MSDSNMTVQETSFTVRGIKIAAKMWGPESGTRVIAVHGWLDNCASFDPLIPQLSGVRVCAVDLAGHGLSDHRPEGVFYNFIDYMADIIGVANQLGWEQFALLGHSMGAGVSLMTTSAFQDRVTKLMLVDSFGPPLIAAEEIPNLMKSSVNKILAVDPNRMPVYADEAAAMETRFKLGGLSREGVATLCSRGLKEVEGGVTWRTDPRIKIQNAQRLSKSQGNVVVQNIKTPICVVMADDGFPWDRELVKERMSLAKDLERHDLPGHHHIHMEPGTREQIAEIFMKFLNREQQS